MTNIASATIGVCKELAVCIPNDEKANSLILWHSWEASLPIGDNLICSLFESRVGAVLLFVCDIHRSIGCYVLWPVW